MSELAGAAKPKLKFLDATLYSLAVGGGIRWIAVAAAVGPSSLPLWLLALVVFFIPLSVATAELTARFEGEGGLYIWVRDAMGPFAGFVCGWFYWIALMPYFAGILYFLGGLILASVGGDPKDTALYLSISLAISCLVTGVQLAGLKYGKWLPNFGTAGGWIVVGLILVMGATVAARGQSATDFGRASYLAPANFDTAILWGTIVFAYSGVEAVGFLRNEIEGGLRTIVRVLAIVGVSSVIIYIAGTGSFLAILPRSELTRLSGFSDAVAIGLRHVGAGWLAPWAIGLFALSMLGGFTAWFGVGARLPFAAGLDHFLPRAFAKRHPRTGAPVAAILLQAALMLIFVGLSQAGTSVAAAYDFLVAMGVLTNTIPYVLVFVAWFRCAKLPPVPGAWAPPGGARTSAVLAIVGAVSSIVAIACTLAPNSGDAHPLIGIAKIVGSTAAVFVAGAAFYAIADRRRKAALALAPAE